MRIHGSLVMENHLAWLLLKSSSLYLNRFILTVGMLKYMFWHPYLMAHKWCVSLIMVHCPNCTLTLQLRIWTLTQFNQLQVKDNLHFQLASFSNSVFSNSRFSTEIFQRRTCETQSILLPKLWFDPIAYLELEKNESKGHVMLKV